MCIRDRLEKSQTALGKFYKQFSNGLTGGEVFLDEVSSSASKSLNKFEIKADKANLAVGDLSLIHIYR